MRKEPWTTADAGLPNGFPEGHTVFFGIGGKVITAPRSEEHSSTIRSMQIDTLALGRHAKVTSDVCLDFPR